MSAYAVIVMEEASKSHNYVYIMHHLFSLYAANTQ